MSKFYEYAPSAVTEAMQEVVSEGWGSVFTMLHPGALQANVMISQDNVATIMKKDSVKKYVIAECDKILKTEQKADKSVTAKVPNGIINSLVKGFKANFSRGKVFSYFANNGTAKVICGNYECYAYGDTDHVEGVVVVLYSKDRDTIIARKIGAPTKADLQEYGYREED